MIKVEIKSKGIMVLASFACPFCDEENVYFDHLQAHCYLCRQPLPNIRGLLVNDIDKVMYHRTGRTVSIRR